MPREPIIESRRLLARDGRTLLTPDNDDEREGGHGHRIRCAGPRAILLGVLATMVSPDVTAAAAANEHPLRPAIRLARESLARVQQLPGYKATLTKTELVDGALSSARMRMTLRRQPFSVYLYFEGANEGREVIYVEGRNGGNLLAHETGLAGLIGTLELPPNGTQAMSENRHPITRAGIEKLLESVIAQWELETKYGEIDVKGYRNAKLGGMTCRVIEASHPQPRRQFPFHMARLWIDEESGIAVRLQLYGFPVRAGDKPPIVEDYAYTDLQTEVRITDRDFDRNNPRYNF